MAVQDRLQQIKAQVKQKKEILERIHRERMDVRSYAMERPSPKLAKEVAKTGNRTFELLAQGDSWFDYPPGKDLIDCLHYNHSHRITNIAVAGSTLNDEVYGPVPREFFGLGPKQSDDPSRLDELVHHIQNGRPQGLIISAGGNDVAGDEFFSFVNNAKSGLEPVNEAVLDGVINTTFKAAFREMIGVALAAAKDIGITMPIFLHSYDYPWPDGRGVISFIAWKVGPWFDNSFNKKNYPNTNEEELKRRHDIMVKFIDKMTQMEMDLEKEFQGSVYHIDLRNTLQGRDEWANELHPVNAGFAKLAVKFDDALQKHIPKG